MIGLIVLALIVGLLGFAIVSIAIGTGTEDDGDIQITGAGEVQSLVGGIQQDGATLGSPDASVTVQVFNDLQCDPCSDWNRDVVVPLIGGPVRAGDLQLIYHNFPMTESGFSSAPTAPPQPPSRTTSGSSWSSSSPTRTRPRSMAPIRISSMPSRAGGGRQLQRRAVATRHERQRHHHDARGRRQAQRGAELPVGPAVVVGGPNGTRQLEKSPSLAEVQAAIAQVQ